MALDLPECDKADDDGGAPGPDDPAARVVRAALIRNAERLRALDPGVRRGEVESIHRMRTAARRLRSELHAFLDLLDDTWGRDLEEELKWLARGLGAVRDIDVLQARLEASAGAWADRLGPLFSVLETRRADAQEALRNVLQGERYRRLQGLLPISEFEVKITPDALEPCGLALPPLVQRTWKALQRGARDLEPTSVDDAFHEVRKEAKRVRYAAEAVAEALGDGRAAEARAFSKHADRIQNVLGAHQDAVIAGEEIRRIAEEHPHDGPFQFAAGRLFERQTHVADNARARFFKVWAKFDRKQNRRWFRG